MYDERNRPATYIRLHDNATAQHDGSCLLHGAGMEMGSAPLPRPGLEWSRRVPHAPEECMREGMGRQTPKHVGEGYWLAFLPAL